MFEASHLQYNITSGYIQIVSGGTYLPAFWAHPELGGPFPGLVMLHDYWGLTPNIRSEARRFAEQGYYVIAPDVFDRQVATSQDEAQALVAQAGDTTLKHVTAALYALRTHHKCNNNIGLIGWGMGGHLALRTAVARDDILAVVTFYSLPDDVTPDQLAVLRCPLMVVLGALDPDNPPEEVDRLRKTLDGMKEAHDLIVCPSVGRDFFDDTRPVFDPMAAGDTWKRALAFLNEHLEVPPINPAAPGLFDPGDVY